MSRSLKRTPVCKDHSSPGTRWAKRKASKAVRRFSGKVPNGKWYRKIFCSWDICDYRFFQSEQQAIHEWEINLWRSTKKHTKEEIIQYWKKCYKRK
ncbi:hypothetical protein [Paenibacillus daejeonensis]|uniref:hypothetical protein n=1 Tax=Paenibacillus daejeonensis TaxID=135193 RepID=UPI000A04D061|nr:hypothetical protein [Paenibacillus daejeonensis]